MVGGGFAWATNPPRGTAYKIDLSGRIVGTYDTGDGAHEPSFSNGKFWVSNESAGTLTSIDAATGGMHTYRFGHPLGTEAALGRYELLAITARVDRRRPFRGSREGREADRADIRPRPARPATQFEPIRLRRRARDLRGSPSLLGDNRQAEPELATLNADHVHR